MANACVFCGSTTEKITRSTSFADWISDVFGREPGGTAELVESDGSIRAFPAVPFQQQVRAGEIGPASCTMSDAPGARNPGF